MTAANDLEDWMSRWDIQAVPDLDDKLRECEFYFALLEAENDRNKFRWVLSGFLNSAYSFFESSALTAYYRFTDADGEPYADFDGLAVLRRHVKVLRNEKNPSFVKTAGLSKLTTTIYEIRKKCTHHFSLSIMIAGTSLPEDFQIGSIRGQGVPAMSLCREALDLVRSVHAEISA